MHLPKRSTPSEYFRQPSRLTPLSYALCLLPHQHYTFCCSASSKRKQLWLRFLGDIYAHHFSAAVKGAIPHDTDDASSFASHWRGILYQSAVSSGLLSNHEADILLDPLRAYDCDKHVRLHVSWRHHGQELPSHHYLSSTIGSKYHVLQGVSIRVSLYHSFATSQSPFPFEPGHLMVQLEAPLRKFTVRGRPREATRKLARGAVFQQLLSTGSLGSHHCLALSPQPLADNILIPKSAGQFWCRQLSFDVELFASQFDTRDSPFCSLVLEGATTGSCLFLESLHSANFDLYSVSQELRGRTPRAFRDFAWRSGEQLRELKPMLVARINAPFVTTINEFFSKRIQESAVADPNVFTEAVGSSNSSDSCCDHNLMLVIKVFFKSSCSDDIQAGFYNPVSRQKASNIGNVAISVIDVSTWRDSMLNEKYRVTSTVIP